MKKHAPLFVLHLLLFAFISSAQVKKPNILISHLVLLQIQAKLQVIFLAIISVKIFRYTSKLNGLKGS